MRITMQLKIRIEPSGHEFSCRSGETILDAALRQGVGLPYGCRGGSCGSCMGHLLSGSVTYPSGKTGALEDQAADACLACQAVPTSPVRLEVREIERPTDIELKTLPCRVTNIEQLAHDVIRIYIKLPESQRLQFRAGQYLEFLLSDGRRRAFSIANAPHDDELIELHIRHVPGGEFTDYVFDKMKEKTVLRFQGPLGNFYLREDSDRPILLIGGGTGFAPLKGIVEHAFHIGVRRPMHLYWGVRSRRDLYLAELPHTWEQSHSQFVFTPVLSEPDADWEGRRGWVHEAVMEDHPNLSGYDIYMSGPPVMINAAVAEFPRCKANLEHIFSDAFEYAADKAQGEQDARR